MANKINLTAHVDANKRQTRLEIKLGTTLVASLTWRGYYPKTPKEAMDYFHLHPHYFKKEDGWEIAKAIGYLPKLAS